MPTHFTGHPATVQALDTYIKFTRASSALEARLTSRNCLDELTLSQFGVLETLYHLGPLCQGELSGKLLKSTGNMTLVLDNLEKHGLAVRIRNTEDRRKVTIALTPAGQQVIEKVFPQVAAAIEAEFSALTVEEQAELGRLCRKLGLGI